MMKTKKPTNYKMKSNTSLLIATLALIKRWHSVEYTKFYDRVLYVETMVMGKAGIRTMEDHVLLVKDASKANHHR
jgi:hypothetical protein